MLPTLATLYMSTLASGEVVFKGRMGQATIKLIANTGPGAKDGEYSLVVVPDEAFGAPIPATATRFSDAAQAPLSQPLRGSPRAPVQQPQRPVQRPTASFAAPARPAQAIVVATAADARALSIKIIPNVAVRGFENRKPGQAVKPIIAGMPQRKAAAQFGIMPSRPAATRPPAIAPAGTWDDLIGDEIPF